MTEQSDSFEDTVIQLGTAWHTYVHHEGEPGPKKLLEEAYTAVLEAHRREVRRAVEAFAERVKAKGFTAISGMDVIEAVDIDVIDAELAKWEGGVTDS